MRQLSTILLLLTLFFPVKSYAAIAKLSLRATMQEGLVRLIMESDDENIINHATVYSSYTLVRVEFPGDFEFHSSITGEDFRYFKKGTSLFFVIKDLGSIKLLRLKSPSRLIIDASRKGETTRKPPASGKSEEGVRDDLPEINQDTVRSDRKNKRPLKRIVLDPGHGGHDLGLYSQSYSEKALVYKVVKNLAYKIKSMKKKVYLSRNYDRHISIKRRILYARKRRPDLFISLHMGTGNHISIYTANLSQLKDDNVYELSSVQTPYREESVLVAKNIGASFADILPNMSVDFRELNLPILSYQNCLAIMIELPGADLFTYNRTNINLLVRSIVRGIKGYEEG